MKPIDFDSLPAQDWLMLRLDEVNAPYSALLAGEFTVDQLEGYCGAIRFALFEFGAHTRRSPGRFTETARALITATEQVLKAASRTPVVDPKWDLVTQSISSHHAQFLQCLKESLQAQKKRKKETARVALTWAASA